MNEGSESGHLCFRYSISGATEGAPYGGKTQFDTGGKFGTTACISSQSHRIEEDFLYMQTRVVKLPNAS